MSEKIRPIHAAIEFIENHLRDEISVADIAVAAGYSLYHFIRTFNQTVHHSPYDYLMRRRLSEAARELLASDRRIIDISLDFCFRNHETFSRAFKRMFAMAPSQWRALTEIPHRVLMPKLTPAYLEHLNRVDFPRPGVVEQNAIVLAGLMVRGGENPSSLLQSLRQTLLGGGIALPQAESNSYRVSTYSANSAGASFFLAGIEIESPKNIPPTLVVQTIPAGTYVRFTHKGTEAACALTLDYIYHTWLPKSDLRPAHPLEVERFGGVITPDAEREISIPVEVANH